MGLAALFGRKKFDPELFGNDRENFRKASERIREWMGRLSGATPKEARRIGSEANAFFDQMREKNPLMYASFSTNQKVMVEKIMRITTGREVTID